MKTHIIQRIKRKAGSLIDNHLVKTGTVLETRHWATKAMVEIDLHLPECGMEWEQVQYIKCRVGQFTFRDYTPAGWDADTHTCTLYVDTRHEGAGAQWAKGLQKGDALEYIGISTTRHAPISGSTVIGLGDESSIGHLFALQQLTQDKAEFTGAVVIGGESSRTEFNEYFRTPLEPIERINGFGHHALLDWLTQQKHNLTNTILYLVGNSVMVDQLRRVLKTQGYSSSQIKAHGFWH